MIVLIRRIVGASNNLVYYRSTNMEQCVATILANIVLLVEKMNLDSEKIKKLTEEKMNNGGL